MFCFPNILDQQFEIFEILVSTPEITEELDFGMYDWATSKKNDGLSEPDIFKWLGVLHKIGPLIPYWILPKT